MCGTLTSHYHKEGWQNIVGGQSSKVLATGIMIEYE